MKQFSIKLRKILLCNYLYYFIVFITLLYVFIYVENYGVKSIFNEKDTLFNLTINDIKIDGDKVSLSFKENIIGSYYLKNIDEKNDFNYGINDKVLVTGKINVPVSNTIPNAFNYKKYLSYKNIKYTISIDNISVVSFNKNIFYMCKNFIIKRINNIENNDYLYAFILGKSSYLDSEVYNNYKINGVTHLFALSGLHVSLFSSFLLFFCKKLKINEFVSIIFVSLFLIFFSFVASFTPSILRATIFFILASLNKYFNLYIKPINILLLVFIILEFINPMYIFNTGFILSFTITFFILLFNENFMVKGSLKSTLIISILSFFSSLPIIINLSYEVNIIGFINNLFFIPFVSYIIFPLSLLTVIFPILSTLLNFLTNIMEYISKISSIILNITIYFKKIRFGFIILYYLFFILSLKKKKLFVVLFLICVCFLLIDFDFKDETLVYFIDVGQGDSTLIITEDNTSILIDTGGVIKYKSEEWKMKKREYNLYTSSVIPFFKSIGLKKIDYLFLTHGDNDHLGYSITLINNFDVLRTIINKGNVNYAENKLDYEFVSDKYVIDNVEIISLNNKDYGNENDNSMVFLVSIYDYKILFTADASTYVEKDIISKYDIPKVDILKVGHHGSDTSTSNELLELISPTYSVISVGKNNKYSHPSLSTINLLNKNNSKIYRTDRDGSILFKLTKKDLKIETYSP